MDFECDEAKALLNQKKHGISFVEASTVVGDPLAITAPDHEHAPDVRAAFPSDAELNKAFRLLIKPAEERVRH